MGIEYLIDDHGFVRGVVGVVVAAVHRSPIDTICSCCDIDSRAL